MRIIDEKGKLLGLINVMDAIILLIILSLIPIGIFGIKIFKNSYRITQLPNNSAYIDFYCIFTNLDRTTAEKVKAGDVEIDARTGEKVKEVMELVYKQPVYREVNMREGVIVSFKNEDLFDVLVRIRIKGSMEKQTFFYKLKEISVNSKINLTTHSYNITGSVIMPPNYEMTELYVRFKKEIGKTKPLALGDKDELIYFGMNSAAEIISILDNNSIDTQEFEELQKLGITKNEFIDKNELIAKIRCVVQKKDGNLYYKGSRIASHLPFLFQTADDSYAGEILHGSFFIEPVEVYVYFEGLDIDIAEVIQEGDVEVEKTPYGERIISEIIDVVSKKPLYYEKLRNSDYEIGRRDYEKANVLLKVKVEAAKQDDKFYFKERPLEPKTYFNMVTNRYNIEGAVVDMKKILTYFIIVLEVKCMPNEILEIMQKGDFEYDADHRLIGILVDFNAAEDKTTKEKTSANFAVTKSEEKSNRDFTLTIRAEGELSNGKIYYKNQPCEIGNILYFQNDKYNIHGKIMNLIRED